MDERELIITIIFSIIGFLAIILIICILIWHIRYRKTKPIKKFKHSPITHRQQYQRSQVLSSSNVINNKRKRRKKRFNTNESTISLSFNPPHLINQNVKNLDKLLATESTLHYEDKQPTHNLDRCYTNPTTEPIYTSSSSNLALNLQSYSQNHNLQFQFLNELNHVLCLKQDKQIRNPVKYSQSCRQRNDLIPFDYYRSITPSASSSIDKLFQSTYNRTTNSANATLMRKARLAQLRDDTAILY